MVGLTVLAPYSRTPLARAAHTQIHRVGGMAETAPLFMQSLVNKACPLIVAT